ncbi:hypothetical protein R5R35_006772 [Gryllus longicercus]|uniref:Glycosyltransferase 2-like domain-containing protein n=1 Tax=Gryllus longicercus TaxID=2509291 RepID=A0AAN9V827_9ORTH
MNSIDWIDSIPSTKIHTDDLRPKTIADVSIIIPIYNGAEWIDDCFGSIILQTAKFPLKLEVSVFNDASDDNTENKLLCWHDICQKHNITLTVNKSDAVAPRGGFAKNQAVKFSTGSYLCFQDVDDIMEPERVIMQYSAAKERCNSIIGCKFKRIPEGSTSRFTYWANSLSEDQLHKQIYTSHGPTLIMPTWFCSRQVFDRVGGFDEDGKGTPEDLLFFYKHLDSGGQLFRVDRCLVIYRYHMHCTTFSVDEMTIWRIRLKRLQEQVLRSWKQFTIWNAGKLGRKLYRSLDPLYQSQLHMFCDVDRQKIGKYYIPYTKGISYQRKIPIVHFTEAVCPMVICVKMGLTGGCFEENLKSLNLTEGKDFVFF